MHENEKSINGPGQEKGKGLGLGLGLGPGQAQKQGLGQGDHLGPPEEHTPIIGVMCMDMAQSLNAYYEPGHWLSYLPASYMRHLEASGALVIPIW